MFLRWCRKKIAESVEDKMAHMGTCPNERAIILNVIAPKDYKRSKDNHCHTDCWNTECPHYHRDNK